ncbi:type 1 glutamine amidotransferase domain-containing protein [Actinoplanes sp. RD1]|uniref:type 1 glutamine amidotransferase domain-containing protein n=1 Tax=Actinoplanes sp. RD1 TaxID=3064538 RepID=UPI0027403399|nr:type 1 glutamine amidotransferase domain-containing protein [Actinoplanes sp. RD1]
MTKKILVVLSEYGYWGEELVGPLTRFDERGYDVVFATPTGARPRALPPSLDPDFVDPPLGRGVVSAEVAKLAREIDESDRLADPISLAGWFSTRPYTSEPDYLRRLEAYNLEVGERLDAAIAEYDALLIVGGSGPIVDLANNGRVHDLILAFLRADKVIGAECYGVACLAFARDWEHRRSILAGKHVTGHCKEYDYKDGTGFLGTDFAMGPPPYPLEYILRDATGPDGQYHGNFGHEVSVLVDYPFVTGRSTPDSFRTGEKIVAALEDGLRRYGW